MQEIIKLMIGVLALCQRHAICFSIMALENVTNGQIVEKSFNLDGNHTLITSPLDSVKKIIADEGLAEWRCPNITGSRSLECGCDLPHTLRCNGDLHGLTKLAEKLRITPYSVALLDISLRNVTFLSDARIFDKVPLRCLIISSGEIKRVHKAAFLGIEGPLLALGLPENALISVPWRSISTLEHMERLDLSNNKIKALGTFDFSSLVNLEYLDLSNNQLSSVSQRTFVNVKKLEVLKLGGNRLGDYVLSLKALAECHNLRDLDLSANNLNGPLTSASLPNLKNLSSLNLNRNLIKSIQNKALENFSKLLTLSLRHNQIDVLQDHAFYGLDSLKILDLSYNGIVAISGASLQHLTHLTTLDLTHNFLRAFTSDLIKPLPSLINLCLSGNDISIVARNALDGAVELRSISMQENPLSCDCTIREFSEWLQTANLVSQDLLTITCATPPKLEGAPLIQVPMEMLNCDMDNGEIDNANIIKQLEIISQKNHSAYQIKDLSDKILLEQAYFSTDFELFSTWTVNLSKNDYICDAIFVYKEENTREILINKSTIRCENKVVDGKHTMSIIVPSSSSLDVGERYRFCLVMIQKYDPYRDIIVGCSNITQLYIGTPKPRMLKRHPYVDFSKLEGSSEILEFASNGRKLNSNLPHQEKDTGSYSQKTFLNSLKKSFFPSIGLGILVISLLVLIWGALSFRQIGSVANNADHDCNSRPSSSTAITCYATSEHIGRFVDLENQTRYLKLQNTKSL